MEEEEQDSAIFAAICRNKFNVDFVLDGRFVFHVEKASRSPFFFFSPLRDCSSTNSLLDTFVADDASVCITMSFPML